MMKEPQPTSTEKERVLLVMIDYKDNGHWDMQDHINEMTELVKTSGGEVVDHVTCHLSKPSARYFIGEGKLEDVQKAVEYHQVQTVIFSHDLKGSHQRNLEEVIQAKTIDRTQLILDIFAKHATSKEGKMQVELAQLEYLLPRLVGKGVELSRLGGGIGTLGPGETKLEVDRRVIGDKITRLKRGLEEVTAQRQLKRKRRKDNGVPTLSLVGYTNAGKSTLLNALTDAKQVTKDGMFTTLDSLSRQLDLPNHQHVIVSDTVGFMHDLPHHLIESFKATLEEVNASDVLIHVIDVTHPHFRNLHQSVMDVLAQLKAHEKPMITVFNKIDRLTDRSWLGNLASNYPNGVCLSAKTKEGVDQLNEKMEELLSALYIEINEDIPINRMDLVNLAHEKGEVISIKYYNDKINIRAHLPAHLAGKFPLKKKIHDEESF
ncbi:MAG: GTPase HflX [Candidatus Omnitrophica bacterium]|nr:GTPase HflX [Candidatus Omnitrophota bacterium]